MQYFQKEKSSRIVRRVFSIIVTIVLFLSPTYFFSNDISSAPSDGHFKENRTLYNEGFPYIDADFSNNGIFLAYGNNDEIVILNTTSWDQFISFKANLTENSIITYSPNGSLLVVSYRNWIHIYDPITGLLINNLTGHSTDIADVAFSFNGEFLVTASDNNPINLWNTSNWSFNEIDIPGCRIWTVNHIEWSKDMKILYISGNDPLMY